MSKKRTYDESYLLHGFTCMVKNGIELPQCVICMKVLSKDSMKPHQLKQHLRTQHAEHVEKGRPFFEAKERQLKRARLDSSGTIHTQSQAVVEASYVLSYRIARDKKPHTIGESLLKPCMLECAKLVLGAAASRKLAEVSLSNNTVKSRIDEVSCDIQQQVVTKIKSSPIFAIQLDESTDVANLSQLMVFARYIYGDEIEEEFLFCQPLEKTTTAADVMKLVSDFFDKEMIGWENLVGVCTDGAPAMLGCRSGFVQLVKRKNPLVEGTHCFIHRQALASKVLPKSLQDHLSTAIKVVNYIKGSALNTRLFHKLCEGLDAGHSSLLFHTEVRWLSKGNMLQRVFELREEVLDFMTQNKHQLIGAITSNDFEPCLAYLVDVFGALNGVNRNLQGKRRNVLHFSDDINAFKDKLKLWRARLSKGNLISFPCLNEILAEEAAPVGLLDDIRTHLTNLIAEFEKYFPKLQAERETLMNLVREPFKRCVDDIPEGLQEEYLELVNNSSMKDEFKDKSVEEFWVMGMGVYPMISLAALRILIPFASTYLCESGFSAMLNIKTKSRNRLNVESDLRCALSRTSPNITGLVKKKQLHKSH